MWYIKLKYALTAQNLNRQTTYTFVCVDVEYHLFSVRVVCCDGRPSKGKSAVSVKLRTYYTEGTRSQHQVKACVLQIDGQKLVHKRKKKCMELNPHRAPKSLPILTSSKIVPKKGFQL